MLPVELHIEGLNSYHQKAQIDFRPLTAQGIFGIFGAVGSGKSSILDAISLCLFGQVERMNKRDKTGYNLMNLSSHELKIQFEFVDGPENIRYLTSYSIKRNKKKFQETGSAEHRAARFENGTWIPFSPRELPAILGLEYDHFRRTVIIPQGQFAEFLHLKDTDRISMLRDIFQLHNLDFQDAVNKLYSRAKDAFHVLDGQLQGMEILPDEQIREWKNQVVETGEKLKKIQQDAEALQAEKSRLQALETRYRQWNEIKTEIARLEMQQPEIQQLEARVQDVQYAQVHLWPVWKEREQAEKECKNLAELLKSDEAEVIRIAADAEKLDAEFAHWKTILLQKEETEMTVLALLQFAKMKETELQLEELLTQKKQKEASFEAGKKELDTIREQLKAIEADLETLEKKGIQPEKWDSLAVLSKALEDLLQKGTALNKQLVTCQSERDVLVKEREAISTQLQADFHELNVSETVSEEELDRWWKITGKNREENLHRETQKQTLAGLVDKLKEGEPCPVCGSLHHPDPITAAAESGIWEEINAHYTGLEIKYRELRKAFQQLDRVDQQIAEKENRMKEMEAERVTLRNSYTKSAQEFKRLNPDNLSGKEIQSRVESANEELEIYTQRKKQKLTLQQQWEAGQLVFSQGEKTIAGLSGNMQLLMQQIQVQQDSIPGAIQDTYSGLSPGELEQKSAQLKSELDTAIARERETSDAIQQNHLKRTALNTRMDERNQFFEKLSVQIQLSEEALQQKLQDKGWSKEQVQAFFADFGNIPEWESRIRAYQREKDRLKGVWEPLDVEFSGKTYDPDALVALLQTEQVLAQHRDELTQLRGELTTVIKDQEQKQQKAVQINRDRERENERMTGFGELSSLFRGQAFMDFVTARYMDNLVRNANQRFYKLSGQTLQLEMNAENDIVVRDFFHEGATRSVKTLSGGQTFQASLCLALALAESVQQYHKNPLNFFFLDEGFGSLDRDSLREVMKVLRSLRQENRVVGVISHVEELKEEIGLYLQIENKAETGSQIHPSWN